MGLLDKLPAFARGNRLVKITPLEVGYISAGEKVEQEVESAGIYEANIITSEYLGGYHLPLIDLDMEAELIPSSTGGHYHLYINHPIKFEAYMKLLEAMRDAGLVQEGVVKGARQRGWTSLRLPHIKKEPPAEEVDADKDLW